ncbi:MAG TPA: hypothetical protein VIJ82_24495 [Streptosporangiaceae bacterium]
MARRYKFRAMLTPAPAGAGDEGGQMHRMVLRAHHHQSHGCKVFSALVTSDDHPGWFGDDHALATIALYADDAGDYFDIGDHFAVWLGSDVADGVVTRRLFI